MTQKPPKGAVASAEDFQVQRDEEGDLLPLWEPIPGAMNQCPDCDGKGVTLDESQEQPEFEPCENCDGEGEVPAMAKVLPLPQGAAQKYLPESGEVSQISDRKTVKLLNDRFVEPDFDLDVNNPKEAIDDFTAFGVEPLVMCLYNASGFEMTRGMVVENAELADVIEGNSKTGN